VSFGGEGRSWEEAVKYGFISAGGGSWFINTLKLLTPGDRIWVYLPKRGYVGVGRVTGFATPQTEFSVTIDGKPNPASDVLACGQPSHDPDKMEHFVPVEWAETVPEDQAINQPGLFRNRNTVCRPKTSLWRTTIDRLQRAFPKYDAV
jgi:hypothetical protein